MLLINDPADAPPGPKLVAVGSFDGLHLGHQHLLHRAGQQAHQLHLPLLIYTFDPPTKVFTRGEGILTSLSEKVELLQQLGIDLALIVPFNEGFARRTKEEFLGDLHRLESHRLYVGQDFAFGRGRAGTTQDLQLVAPTEVIPLVEIDGVAVKSSLIRDLLRHSQVERAAQLLGRPYSAEGLVGSGDRLGRTLGFPTANLEGHPQKILPPGVFAVSCRGRFGQALGVANLGYRPTVAGRVFRFEVHLLDFDQDLYGQEMQVAFHRFLRAEQKFDGLDALRRQLATDVAAARHWFETETPSLV
jgi:riboflavin kinase/FMN adenylyltransferase